MTQSLPAYAAETLTGLAVPELIRLVAEVTFTPSNPGHGPASTSFQLTQLRGR